MPADAAAVLRDTANDPPRTRAGKHRLRSLASLDKRTAVARRTHQLIASIANDLGGPAVLSEGTRQLIQRAAILAALAEDYEARWVAGEPIDLEPYLSATNAQRRILATIGLERRAKDVTPAPSFDAYVSARAADLAGAPDDAAQPTPAADRSRPTGAAPSTDARP